MDVKLTFRSREYMISSGMTLRSALLKLNIPVESVLAVRRNTLITDDEILKDGDEIKLVPVISGG
ncbi:MAG: MoaD/ThiS family protein [Anaerolineales bacterium]|nr:MoaD/ThiS family protein [Anaerolineales bacterium]